MLTIFFYDDFACKLHIKMNNQIIHFSHAVKRTYDERSLSYIYTVILMKKERASYVDYVDYVAL